MGDLRGFAPGSTAPVSAGVVSSGPGMWGYTQSSRQPLREMPGTPEKYALRQVPGRFDTPLSGVPTQPGSDLKEMLTSIGAGSKLTSGTSSALLNVPALDQIQNAAGRLDFGQGH